MDDLFVSLNRQGREIQLMRQFALDYEAALRLDLSRATAQLSVLENAYKQELSSAKEAFLSLEERFNALVDHTNHLLDALEAARAKIEDLKKAQD